MSNQTRTKTKILKKCSSLGKKKRDYNCHTNFKFSDLKNSDQWKNESQVDKPKLDYSKQKIDQKNCEAISKSIDLNKNTAKEDDNRIKKKQSLIPRLIGYSNNNKDTLFNRIFRSLTSSSSSNHQLSINSNLSPNTSDNLNTSTGCLNLTSSNDKFSVAASTSANKAQPTETKNLKKINKSFDLKEMKNSKSFNLNELKSKNSMKLNFSLSSLETSPKRLTSDLTDTLERI